MILDLVPNGPLVWPTVVEDDGTTRTKRSKELSVAEELQAECDLKAINIILQGFPPDVSSCSCVLLMDDPIAYLNKAMAFLTVVASL
nr:hypothetical protein [Tanacetum cinerariifolium]